MVSSGSPRWRAASMATLKFSLTLVCPTYSDSRFGRSDSSRGASSSAKPAPTTRFDTLFLRQNLKCSLEQYIKACAGITRHRSPRSAFGKSTGIAEVFECRQPVRLDWRLRHFNGEFL